jgi:predicted  nucleic acid-binding Zn-ribbon protein
MNYQDEIFKTILGLAIAGIFSGFYKLFHWLDRTDLKIHDLTRDIEHIKRSNVGLSQTVANLDAKDERMIAGFRRTIYSLSGRIARIETRVYVVENRLSDSLTQAIDRVKDTALDSKKIDL